MTCPSTCLWTRLPQLASRTLMAWRLAKTSRRRQAKTPPRHLVAIVRFSTRQRIRVGITRNVKTTTTTGRRQLVQIIRTTATTSATKIKHSPKARMAGTTITRRKIGTHALKQPEAQEMMCKRWERMWSVEARTSSSNTSSRIKEIKMVWLAIRNRKASSSQRVLAVEIRHSSSSSSRSNPKNKTAKANSNKRSSNSSN